MEIIRRVEIVFEEFGLYGGRIITMANATGGNKELTMLKVLIVTAVSVAAGIFFGVVLEVRSLAGTGVLVPSLMAVLASEKAVMKKTVVGVMAGAAAGTIVALTVLAVLVGMGMMTSVYILVAIPVGMIPAVVIGILTK